MSHDSSEEELSEAETPIESKILPVNNVIIASDQFVGTLRFLQDEICLQFGYSLFQTDASIIRTNLQSLNNITLLSVYMMQFCLSPSLRVNGLKQKLEQIKLNLDWSEKLSISVQNASEESKAEKENNESQAESDFKREMSFYNQATVAATKALNRLKGLGIPTKRPNDYLAEMAKSDAHMVKVREKLLSKQAAIERTDKIREIREQKKLGKKVQVEVLQQKKMEKKKMINALKKAKKGKISAENLLSDEKKGFGKKRKGKKFREFKNEKYGYGGKKKYSKWNTAESSSQFPGDEKQKEKKKMNIDKRHKFKPRATKKRRRR